jgi:hypothetical protein
MGDGLDGLGDGTIELIILLIIGTPLAIVLLIVLAVVYMGFCRKRSIRIWPRIPVVLLIGSLGILIGLLLGGFVIVNATAELDECQFLKRQSHRNDYTARDQAEKHKIFESKNCPAILQAYTQRTAAMRDQRQQVFAFIGYFSPSLGLLTGFFGTLTVARFRRR